MKYQSVTNSALAGTTFDKLKKRTTALQEKLTFIESDQNSLGLATSTELRQLAALDRINSRLTSLPKTSGVAVLQEKEKRIRGMLLWQIDQEYKKRLSNAQQSLADLDPLLEKSRGGRLALQETRLNGPTGFEGFQTRINTQRNRISKTLARTTQTRLTQGRHVEQLAIRELEAQKKRIDVYVIQARYALAQTYDRALNTYSEPALRVVQ